LAPEALSQLFERELIIGIDAQAGGNPHCLLGDGSGI
jgi:hypothetical protein